MISFHYCSNESSEFLSYQLIVLIILMQIKISLIVLQNCLFLTQNHPFFPLVSLSEFILGLHEQNQNLMYR